MNTTTMRIHVTKDVLNKAKYCAWDKKNNIPTTKDAYTGSNCAIAVAINDLFPNSIVSSEEIYFFKNKEEVDNYYDGYSHMKPPFATCLLPEAAIEMIYQFDDSNPVEREQMEPLSFDIEIHDKVLETISLDEVSKALSGSKTMELV